MGEGYEDGDNQDETTQKHEGDGFGCTLHTLIKADNNHVEREEYEADGKQREAFGAHVEGMTTFGKEQGNERAEGQHAQNADDESAYGRERKRQTEGVANAIVVGLTVVVAYDG